MILASGKYEFYVSGVIATNKDGQPLKTSKGNSYKKIRLSVLDDKGQSHTVFDAIFGKDRVEQIVASIGKKELQDSFNKGNLKLESLIGEGGRCILAIKEGANGYQDQNVVSVYIKPSANEEPVKSGNGFKATQQELVPDSGANDSDYDDIPF